MGQSLFQELKRRNVFKVGVGYLVLGWVILQVADVIIEPLHLPDWTMTMLIVIGTLGFPLVLFFAWAFELTPEGLKRDSEIDPQQSITIQTGHKINHLIIALMSVALVLFAYDKFFTDVEPLVTDHHEVAQGASIAVLPFVNMSSDPEQEYFSDGISEEILNVLAKIPNLQVTSRSSAFAFKGKDINIAEVAQKLNVDNVLEGSVRKSGNRIRITAQLINASTDKHIWSETYDRELLDIFTIQDEISSSIVTALKAQLGLEVVNVNPPTRGVDLEAYNEYLHGKFFVEQRNQASLEKALEYFDKAIAIAPDYAPAWMGKAWAISFLSELNYGNIPTEIAEQRARVAAEKSITLDPKLAEAYAIMGIIEMHAGNSDAVKQNLDRAIQLNPNLANAYAWYAEATYESPVEQMNLREKALKLDPMSMLNNNNYALSLLMFGRYQEAEAIINQMNIIDDNHFMTHGVLAQMYYQQGELAEALLQIQKFSLLNPVDSFKLDYASFLEYVGLPEQAGEVVANTKFHMYKHLYMNNLELYISQSRQEFPRSANDSLGNYYRGLAELFDGNYQEASQYLMDSVCKTCDALIFVLKQVNDLATANRLLDERRKVLVTYDNAGVIAYYDPLSSKSRTLNQDKTVLAYLEDDIDEAISYIKADLDNGYILDSQYALNPMYQQLTKHTAWHALEEISAQNQLDIQAELASLQADNQGR